MKKEKSKQETFSYQGKRPDQVASSQKIFFWSMVSGIIIITLKLILQ